MEEIYIIYNEIEKMDDCLVKKVYDALYPEDNMYDILYMKRNKIRQRFNDYDNLEGEIKERVETLRLFLLLFAKEKEILEREFCDKIKSYVIKWIEKDKHN